MPEKVFGMVNTATSSRYTLFALRSFFAHTPLADEDQFLLIDNDCSLDQPSVASEFPSVEWVRPAGPQSFAANLNVGLRRAVEKKADLYFLNNDIIFPPGWLKPLLINKRALLTPACNMQFSYRVKDFSFELTMELEDYLGNEEVFLELVKRHCSVSRGYQLIHSVPFYCIKVPYSVSQDIGFFDEAYQPAGWEDIDYTLRCYLQGIPLLFALDSLIIHFYGKTTWRRDDGRKPTEFAPFPEVTAREVFLRKWGSELADIFGYQRSEAVAYLKRVEQEAIISSYGSLIRSKMPKEQES